MTAHTAINNQKNSDSVFLEISPHRVIGMIITKPAPPVTLIRPKRNAIEKRHLSRHL